MQIYPQRLVYAGLCFLAAPLLIFGAGVITYYVGSYIGPDVGVYFMGLGMELAGIYCFIAGVGFLITVVNVEVWDSCYRRM